MFAERGRRTAGAFKGKKSDMKNAEREKEQKNGCGAREHGK